MKKFFIFIICLMTALCFTSCENNIFNKFKLEDNYINTSREKIVRNALERIEQYYYLHSKYDPEILNILRTKIHIETDTLLLGEIYVRGKNSFDGGTCSNRLFVFLERGNDSYLNMLDDDEFSYLIMRLSLTSNNVEKSEILSNIATQGNLNGLTTYENIIASKSHKEWVNKMSKKDKKEVKWWINTLNDKLGLENTEK